MKNQKGFSWQQAGFVPIIIILVVLIGFVGVYYLGTFKPKLVAESPIPTEISTNVRSLCEKENNCCVKSEDCKYIWVTGACNTPEYVAKKQKEAEGQGRRDGEAPPRENVSCTCESNKCVTHN